MATLAHRDLPGFHDPSATEAEVVGASTADFALNVHFEEDDLEDTWFASELVEYVSHGPPSTATIGESHFTIDEESQWHPVNDE